MMCADSSYIQFKTGHPRERRGAGVGCWGMIVVILWISLSGSRAWASHSALAPVPPEIASNHFVVTIDGQQTPVMHAALNLYFLNFEAHKHMTISVTASTDDFWGAGVEVQPWRLGIRPHRKGRTITFKLDGPAKIAISRPGDYLTQAEMLYLFANAPEKDAPVAERSGLRYIGPGAHTENIDAHTGDRIYLAPGAVVFGSLNVWKVDHVKVFGPGVIVYDGPQNPGNDDGWMHKPNWHCIVMDNAHDISISDITCVVRSRTWQIQMKDSRQILYDNIKVIGANAGNANADGMDWLGGGDTIVRNSFFRAADDDFALQSSWDGYGPAAFAEQGRPVTNISIENSVLSTSISNIVRVAWPRKNFDGGNFSMTNSDVLQTGIGGCGVPFALMELWADPGGRGSSSGYHFKDIRLDDWYSLFSLRQPTPVRDVQFTDIAALATPSLVPSVMSGDIAGVSLDNVVLAGKVVRSAADVPIVVGGGATPPSISDSGPLVQVISPHGWLHPRETLRLEARPEDSSTQLHYTWFFGDGTAANGRKVKHRFPDAEGTLLDGSGLYRVLLHVSNDNGRNTWVHVPVVIRDSQIPALSRMAGTPGVVYRLKTAQETSLRTGTVPALSLDEVHPPERNYSVEFLTDVDVPEDGGYVFTVIANDSSSISIDGKALAKSPAPFAQVCGLEGSAAQPVTVAVELSKGLHHLDVAESHAKGIDDFRVLWQQPGQPMEPIPVDRLSHR
jgi:hypothetical protein